MLVVQQFNGIHKNANNFFNFCVGRNVVINHLAVGVGRQANNLTNSLIANHNINAFGGTAFSNKKLMVGICGLDVIAYNKLGVLHRQNKWPIVNNFDFHFFYCILKISVCQQFVEIFVPKIKLLLSFI